MNGIVLWTGQGQALIWCEDQGPLAFCDLADLSADVTLSSGDLVLFRSEQSQDLRIARGVERIAPNVAPALAGYLASRAPKARAAAQGDSNVVTFDPSRRTWSRETAARKPHFALG